MLLDNRTLGGPRPQRIVRHIESRPRFVEFDAGKRAPLHQPLGSRKVDLRLTRLRLQRVDLRIQGLHLKRELFVRDRRYGLAARDRITLAHTELDNCSAYAPPSGHHADALNRRKHSLLVGHQPRSNRERFRKGHRHIHRRCGDKDGRY